jgi:AcrR family transcriptional regulator
MATPRPASVPGAGKTDDVEWQEVPGSVRAAVDRALSRHQRDALGEVEQILDAALRVAERVSPAEPKVADIVAEAGTSNQTFYRYFAGKPDLLLAVVERGLVRVGTYLEHQMAKHTDPVEQLVAWVDGLLTQLVRPEAARQGAAVMQQMTTNGRMREPAGLTLLDRVGALLVAPLTTLGRPEPARDAQVLQETLMGVLQRHVVNGTTPDAAERAHLVGFCVRAVGADGR